MNSPKFICKYMMPFLALFLAGPAHEPSMAHARLEPDPMPDRKIGRSYSRTFYIDREHGDDGNTGTSPVRAWKSVEQVNRTELAPGDRALFAAGQTFKGSLKLTKATSGEKGRPILISSFGKGRATIDAEMGDGFVLKECAYILVRNLNFVGCGRKNGSNGAGISLIRTQNLDVSEVDVSGFRGAGIATEGDANTRLIHIRAHDNGAAGIMTNGGYDAVPPVRNLYIGYCIVENNPGDPKNLANHSGNGIVIGGAEMARVEYCEATNNGWDMPRKGNGPVGIWGWQCDRLTIQHCISHDNKSPGGDGGGFDFDGGVTNSVMQYNLSYNNVGCGYLLCQYPGAKPWKHNILRYNISINDGARNFQCGIGLSNDGDHFSDAQVYNNTVVNSRHAVAAASDVPGILFQNNIFIAGDDILYGDLTHSRFESNLYWSTGTGALCRSEQINCLTLAEWAKATHQEEIAGHLVGLFANPHLTLPTENQPLPTDPRKLTTMRLYRLQTVSPCLRAGRVIANNGGHDLSGNRLPSSARPSLGAFQYKPGSAK